MLDRQAGSGITELRPEGFRTRVAEAPPNTPDCVEGALASADIAFGRPADRGIATFLGKSQKGL